MDRFYIPLLILTLFTEEVNSQNYVRSEFFAVLPFWESPYIPFKGACPITEAEAMKRVHLKIDYDEENRVTTVHVKIGVHYKEFEGFFGHLYINAPLTKVEYANNKEVHSFFDRFGNSMAVMENVYQKVYEKDSMGRNVQLTFKNKAGAATSDAFGNMIYKWHHQSDGSIVEIRKDMDGNLTPLRGSFQFKRTKMVFGPGGYFGILHNVNEKGELINTESGISSFKYYYDSKGRFLRWEVYDKNGSLGLGPSNTAGETNSFYQYDLMDISFFNAELEPAQHWSGAERWHFDVDRFGNRTTLTYQSSDRSPINANRGYAKVQYKWSNNGRFLLSQSYYDESGLKTQNSTTGVHEIRYLRNELGQINEIKYLNEHGESTNRLDNGICGIRQEFNSDGVLISSKPYSVGNE